MIPTAHPSPQPKQHLHRFSRIPTGDRRVSLYFTTGRPFPPQNCTFPWGDLDPHLIHGSLGPPESNNPNGISIGSAVFAGLTSVTDRPTDHATWSVTIGRIYVRSTAMRRNNNNNNKSNNLIYHVHSVEEIWNWTLKVWNELLPLGSIPISK